MWPEKIAAIYVQFPWLEKVFSQTRTHRAYVKRFEENVLDIHTETRFEEEGEIFRVIKEFEKVSLYLVDQRGVSVVIGKIVGYVRRFYLFPFGFRSDEDVTYLTKTVRQAIQELPRPSTVDHVVLIQHGDRSCSYDDGKLNRLTVFKPPQNGITLRQWYDDQVISINKTVAEEIEKT